MKRFKEGISKAAKYIAELTRQSEARKEKLINLLIPHFNPKAIRQIVAHEKGFYSYYKKEAPSNETLLRKHLNELIWDFDCNIHYLEEDEMPALAEIINKKPLASFFSSLD
ncbi:hypothetical protein KKB71_00435 [Patescibacteria group bacterium]|nr:hypothetical protein [Patescibacteria group bacterium]MBU2263665.1 hypothetical protein [Patescibacteria group bacterium]